MKALLSNLVLGVVSFLMVSTLASTAFAVASVAASNDFALVLGVRSNSADSPNAGETVNSKTGFGLGVEGFFNMTPNWVLRSGFLYNQRNYSASVSGSSDTDLNLAYIDIPITAEYKFAEYGGAFAGPVVSFLASHECSTSGALSCSALKSPDSTAIGFQFGASFKFAPQMGAELYYELMPSEFWSDALKSGKTVGANFLITFE